MFYKGYIVVYTNIQMVLYLMKDIYIRLSQTDRNLKFRSESESIANQRALLRRYINTHPDLAGCIVEEFVDDGYSGTNADRPSFEQMIERIKNGEGQIIICKDFSRFFRDYVEIGDYLERIFPFLGVRFISVNDGYDSDDYKGTTAGMEVVMKYIVYSSYSHDLSKKIKTVMQAKHRKGQWVGSYAPFGYSKDTENKNHLVPNPDTAPVVRKIFDLALSGKKISEIAAVLNDEGIETPAAYFRRMNPGCKKHEKTSSQACWNNFNVRRIIQTKLYTGAMISNKKKWKSIDDPRTLQKDESEWIVVPNCHEAIVSDDEFEKAQSAVKKINKNYNCTPKDYLLRSLVTCGVCGRAMSRYARVKRKYYVCRISAADANTECPIGEKFYEDELEKVVTQDLREKLQLFVDNQRRIKEAETMTYGTEANIRACIEKTEKQLKQKTFERQAAYEKYVDEIISRDEFFLIKNKLSYAEAALKDELAQYQNRLNIILQQKNDNTDKLAGTAEEFLSQQAFTNKMLLYFIDKVKVYSGNRIEIIYRYKDVFDDVMTNK